MSAMARCRLSSLERIIQLFLCLCIMYIITLRRWGQQTLAGGQPYVPCMYENEMDLRIIVMVNDRSDSLQRVLQSIQKLELDNENASVEIWIDIPKNGYADPNTVKVAGEF